MTDSTSNPRKVAAHEYARRGWQVIPLHHITSDGHCSCRAGMDCPPKTRGKHPVHRDWPRLASRSGADVEAWWDEHPEANVGIVTGAESGLFVVDVDPDNGGDATLAELERRHGALPKTWTVRTGSGGLHLYLAWPDFDVRNSAGRVLGPGLDVRGASGLVVAPPSCSASGEYVLADDALVAGGPEWLLDLLRPKRSPERLQGVGVGAEAGGMPVPSEVADRYAAAVLAAEVAAVRATRPGGQNDALNRAAFALGQLVAVSALDEALVRTALISASTASGYPARDSERAMLTTIDSGLVAGCAQPRTPWPPIRHNGALPEEDIAVIRRIYANDPDTLSFLLADTVASAGSESHGFHPAGSATTTNTYEDAGADVSGWERTDLGPILDGTYNPPEPGVLYRDDGVGMFYPGRVHQVIGEPESGKSWLALIAVAARLADGQPVLYLDYESDAVEIVRRLLALGVERAAIREHLDYRHPEVGVDQAATTFAELLTRSYALAVVDGVTDALGTHGASVTDNDEVAKFIRKVPDRLARETGAAVILIDHVAKSQAPGSARFALGAQHKLGKVRGTSYLVEPRVVLAPGTRGELMILLGKDSAGGVRRHCPPPDRVGARLQLAARLVIDARDPEHLHVTLRAPRRDDATVALSTEVGKRGQRYERRPEFMERVSRALERNPNTLSSSEIRRNTTGQAGRVDKAVEALVIEGYVHRFKRDSGPGHYHKLVRRFREADGEAPATPPTATLDGAATVAEDVA